MYKLTELVSLATYKMHINVVVLSRTLYFLPREDNSSLWTGPLECFRVRTRKQTVRGEVRQSHFFPLASTPFSPGGLFLDWVKRPF